MPVIIETERLILRTWCDDDLEPMFRINQDPKVMEYLLPMSSKQETQDFIDRAKRNQEVYGYTFYAVELKSTHEMIGFIGLLHRKQVPFSDSNPSTEIGWRLASKHWGKGFATEGATAVLAYAFHVLYLPEVVSLTVVNNTKSRRVMEKIGLTHNPDDDFDHPKVPDDSPLKQHVLYRLFQQEYLAEIKPLLE
ncbi:MAG: GNAT family N-acetyltransferase [Gammaproteobacteria bacterium]|nr:GNAT family N-acetyltransferase [Gammaproteobacteria bacterium]